MMIRLKLLAVFGLIAATLASAPRAQPEPGEMTQVNVGGRLGIDTTWNFAGDPITIEVEVQVHVGSPVEVVDLDATVVVASGTMTRREIAQAIADQLRADLTAAGHSTGMVTNSGSAVHVTNTPVGEGPNTGTTQMPVRGGHSDNNRPYTLTTTTKPEE